MRNAANDAYINVSTVGGAETVNFGLARYASPTFTGDVTINSTTALRVPVARRLSVMRIQLLTATFGTAPQAILLRATPTELGAQSAVERVGWRGSAIFYENLANC